MLKKFDGKFLRKLKLFYIPESDRNLTVIKEKKDLKSDRDVAKVFNRIGKPFKRLTNLKLKISGNYWAKLNGIVTLVISKY